MSPKASKHQSRDWGPNSLISQNSKALLRRVVGKPIDSVDSEASKNARQNDWLLIWYRHGVRLPIPRCRMCFQNFVETRGSSLLVLKSQKKDPILGFNFVFVNVSMNLMELHCHLSSAWSREFLFSVQGDATFCRICWSPFSSCALPGRVAKSAFPDIFWKPTNFSRFVQTNTYSCTKSSSTWHLKALEPELNRLEKALEDEAQRNETALNQAGLQRHLIQDWYRFSTWQSRNSTQKLTAIKVWSHFSSTLLRQKKLKTWCLLRCVIWKHLLEKSKESWRRTNSQSKTNRHHQSLTVMLQSCYVVLHNSKPRRPTYFELRKLLCQEIASHSQQLEGELTEAKINQAHIGGELFAFRAETSHWNINSMCQGKEPRKARTNGTDGRAIGTTSCIGRTALCPFGNLVSLHLSS